VISFSLRAIPAAQLVLQFSIGVFLLLASIRFAPTTILYDVKDAATVGEPPLNHRVLRYRGIGRGSNLRLEPSEKSTTTSVMREIADRHCRKLILDSYLLYVFTYHI
jgi:hypothetical protein